MSAAGRTLPAGSADESQRLDRVNVAVLVLQTLAWGVLLSALSRAESPAWTITIIAAFCLVMQGVFSMMHECFHQHGHRNARINTLMCWFSSTLFGASATLIRVNHLGHHVRNRTKAERVDYIDKGESRLVKTIAYYFAISGGIWFSAAGASLLLPLLPPRWLERLRSRSESNTYAAGLADFTDDDFRHIRIEVFAALVFWVLAFYTMDLSPGAVGLAYLGLAVSWSSLQWIYHLRTPLDVVEGTYNLRAPRVVRWCLLNFNYNLTHHRDPGLRWQAMHAVTNLAETRPLWKSWLAILRPPEPLPDEALPGKSYY